MIEYNHYNKNKRLTCMKADYTAINQASSTLTNWGRDKMAGVFSGDVFKCIFMNENIWISIKISLKLVPKGSINNIPALVQIMAWRRRGDNHFLNLWWLVYWRIYASLGLNELIAFLTGKIYDISV